MGMICWSLAVVWAVGLEVAESRAVLLVSLWGVTPPPLARREHVPFRNAELVMLPGHGSALKCVFCKEFSLMHHFLYQHVLCEVAGRFGVFFFPVKMLSRILCFSLPNSLNWEWETNNTECRGVVLTSNTTALADKEWPDQIHLKIWGQFMGFCFSWFDRTRTISSSVKCVLIFFRNPVVNCWWGFGFSF